MLKAQRVNVVFFDQKRNEIYKRIRDKTREYVESTRSCAYPRIGYPSTKGFASLCIHTLSSIVSHNVKEDARFCAALDDPAAPADNPAITLLAVPIMSREDRESQQFALPRGAVVAVNKEGGADFSRDDVDNVTQYNCLASKIFDVTTYSAI